MRTFALLAILPLAASSLVACSAVSDRDSTPGLPGTGQGTTRTFDAADFTAVDLRGSDDIDVRVGSAFSVRAEGPAEELDKLKIERDGDTLKVGRITNTGFGWNAGKGKVTVYVTMPRIAEGTLAGSGNLTIDRAEGEEFAGALAGSGNFTIGALAVQTVKLDIAGSGSVKAGGTTRRLSVDIAGSGDVDARALKAASADVSIAGSGDVRADVAGPAKIDLMGSGNVDLGTGARCTTNKVGSGDVKCGS